MKRAVLLVEIEARHLIGRFVATALRRHDTNAPAERRGYSLRINIFARRFAYCE
ncbi:MAG: hypothetical protein QOI22_1235 [Verrucomicrobiota bacterium]